MRGAVLVGVAVLIGALILGWGANDSDSLVVVPEAETAAVATPIPTTAPQVQAATPTPIPPVGEARNPSEVRVQVANAAEIQGKAGDLTNRLQAQGYRTAAPTNATPTSISTVYFQLGYEADARAILEIFQAPATQVIPMPNPRPEVENPDSIDGGANIIMIVGSDDLSKS